MEEAVIYFSAMITLALDTDCLIVDVSSHTIDSRHLNQLAFWGFTLQRPKRRLVSRRPIDEDVVLKVTAYLIDHGVPFMSDDGVRAILKARKHSSDELQRATAAGRRFKGTGVTTPTVSKFLDCIDTGLSRPLKAHQKKAAAHLLAVKNAANFSVPGSGKTSVVLAVFQYLRLHGHVDALFVVGPPACFDPWRAEYAAVLGRAPSCEVFAGGDVLNRRGRYHVTPGTAADLYLTSFQTLQRDSEQVVILFQHQGIRFFFVIDEAHYIKQLGGAWASAALAVAKYASRRCILTGTPFPHSYVDSFNLFDALWPHSPPMSDEQRNTIKLHVDQGDLGGATAILDDTVAPLFYRVRKSDLHLAPQRFHDPIVIAMRHYERVLYDAILDKICALPRRAYHRNIEVVARLWRGRIMRLRQCLSYAALLRTAIAGYDEELLSDDLTLSAIIQRYDDLERPAKLDRLLDLLDGFRNDGQKVVIWSNFVGTLELIHSTVENAGMHAKLIYGRTPFCHRDDAEPTRADIIREFCRANSGLHVLVANPAACAESVSLHKACSHAIYYDLSYNCAQYLQSLDRIHRVGGSETTEAHYYFLQYDRTLDQDVLASLRAKAERMSAVIDRDYPVYSLDMFAVDTTWDDDADAYEKLFRHD